MYVIQTKMLMCTYLLGWTEKHFFGKCRVLMSQKLPYGTKTLHTKFELDLWGVGWAQKRWSFGDTIGGGKKVSIFTHFEVRKFRHDERLPNLVLKLKSDIILPLFRQQKTVEIWQIWLFCHFLPFLTVFGPKRGLNVIRVQFWDQIWYPVILAKLPDLKMK